MNDIKKNINKIKSNSIRVLLIDDNVILSSAIKHNLTSEGFLIDEAKKGTEAIEILNHQSFDLLILNLDLKGMGGLKTIAMLKSSNNNKNIPLVVFSESYSEETRERVLHRGADEFITFKETETSKLVRAVNMAMGLITASSIK